MAEYKIGQILTATQDIEVQMALSGDKKVIPKGSKAIIGADNLAHHLRDGMIQPLGNATVNGYDTKGLAQYLVIALKSHFPLYEMLDNYDITESELQEELEYALAEIGL